MINLIVAIRDMRKQKMIVLARVKRMREVKAHPRMDSWWLFTDTTELMTRRTITMMRTTTESTGKLTFSNSELKGQ